MAIRDTVDAEASRLVGRYELLAPVVSGALGELWQARIASGPEEGRVVDIRRIPRSVGLEKRDVERLTNAGFAAMELRNPRIAAVLDIVVGAAEIAVVSEHIAGAVLQRVLSPRPGNRTMVPSGVAVRIALDLLEAIDALREPWAEIFPSDSADDALLRASLHGGLLPDGLLVASYGEAMLLEAGLAGVALTVPAILARPDVIAYRAPEQLEPGRPIDERADVFGVGILLWEMIAGRTLFGPVALPRAPSATAPVKMRADPIAVSGARRRVLSHPIARVDALPPLKGKLRKELADWVARCLERDPARRFRSVREAIDSLSALGEPAVSPHGSVVAFVESLGLTAPVLPAQPGTDESHDDVTADFGETAQAHAARMLDSIPPGTDVESLPPSEPPGTDVESLPPSEPPSRDVESLPPSTDVESLPPSEPPSRDVESLPTPRQQVAAPGAVHIATMPHAEAVTVPPLMALEANRLELVARGSFPPVNAARAGDRAPGTSAATLPLASGVEERDVGTSAPIVGTSGHGAGASPSSGGADEPELSVRRARSKKIVLGVLTAAVLLVILAVLRAALVGAPDGASAAQAVVPTTQAVVAEAPRQPSVRDAPPTTATPSAQASAATPTSVPDVPPGNPPANANANANLAEKPVRKAASAKKQPWRPSGI